MIVINPFVFAAAGGGGSFDFYDDFSGTSLDARYITDNMGGTFATFPGGYLQVTNSKSVANDVGRLLVDVPSGNFRITAYCEVDQGNWPKTGVLVYRSSNGYWMDICAARQSTSTTPIYEGSAFTPSYSDNTVFVSGAQPGWVRIERNGTNYKFWTSTNGSSWTLQATIAQSTYLGGAADKAGLAFNAGNPTIGTPRIHKVYWLQLEELP